MSNRTKLNITPDVILRAYMLGVFPMAETKESKEIFWVDPESRGMLPFENFHIPKSLVKTVKKEKFTIHIDKDFRGVMENCRATRPDRLNSWINDEILNLYCNLAERGHAHSVEAWLNDGKEDRLVGGLYGVSIGAAFFGESMFSFETDASKVALVYLIARLKYGGYTMLDTQFTTEHLSRFGAIEVPRGRYHTYLQDALEQPADFYSLPISTSSASILQLSGHKS